MRQFFVYRIECDCGTHVAARYHQRTSWLYCDQCSRTLWDDAFKLIGIANAQTKQQAIDLVTGCEAVDAKR
jgi:hypothetical protein